MHGISQFTVVDEILKIKYLKKSLLYVNYMYKSFKSANNVSPNRNSKLFS